MGKEEIAQNKQFLLLFPQCFLLNQVIVFPLFHIFDIISLFAAELEEPKIGISDKGLRLTLKQNLIYLVFKKGAAYKLSTWHMVDIVTSGFKAL